MKPTLTIGIPAYNEAKNVSRLLHSILYQNSNLYSLKSIIVSSDGSTDNTVEIVRSISNAKIKVLDNRNRLGIARGLNQIISLSHTDILVTLDADIIIKSNGFIDELISPIINQKADLTSSSIQHVKSNSSTSTALQLGMQIKQRLFDSIDNTNNIYHCYGLARAYSHRLYSNMIIPISIGNDMYTYLHCLDKNYLFIYVKNAVAYYRIPTNFKDHASQSHRFTASGLTMETFFGTKLVREQLKVPWLAFVRAIISSFPIIIMHPLITIHYIFIQIMVRLIKRGEIRQAWNIAESSK